MDSKTTIRMNDLFIQYDAHSLTELETRELVSLMFTELNARATTIKFLGGQLKDAKELVKCGN